MNEQKESPEQPLHPPTEPGAVPVPRPPAAPASARQPYDIPTLGEEFDRAKWTLPPISMLAVAIVGVAIIVAVVMYLARYKPATSGSLGDVASVELADHNSVMVAINVTVHNISEKPLWIHEITAAVDTSKGKFSDDAASAVDFNRYYQAYPSLKQKALPALTPEMKIAPGGELKGTVIVGFPVNEDTFEHRKSLSVTVLPYDQRPLVISSGGGSAGK